VSSAGYTEDQLVEQPAIELLQTLGWDYYYAYDEFNGQTGSPLGRQNKGEVVLTSRLRPIIEKLNPDLPKEAVVEAIEELSRDRSRMSPVAANREVYDLVKNGVRVTVQDEDGNTDSITVRLIDWDNPENNDFLLCSQLWITGEMHTRRTDLVGFVNGIPLVFIELKASHVHLESAFKDNLTDYKDVIPQLFWYNAFIVLSNGSKSKIGTMSAGWEHFSDWKRVGSESEEGRISLETMLRGTCEPSHLTDLVENFVLFMEVPGGLIKLIAKNHQYLGVKNALEAHQNIKQRDGRLGVFWHTQGSGKSISMILFAQSILRNVEGNWTFVIVTDRKELDDQIYKNFVSTGAITEDRAQAESSKHLRELLSEDHRYVFTLIHKFREPEKVSDRDDIIVITDEAHRSQYDTLALNMRTALPNASFLAFTGTPLIAGEEKTRDVFGEYISIYDFKQSVEDGATVPLFYENRIPELQLTNENLNEDMEALLEKAELDEDQEKKLEREFGREYHLITREDRLAAVAKDIVEHFTTRGFDGKGMVICIDKATAVRMYNKVQEQWAVKLEELLKAVEQAPFGEQPNLTTRIKAMQETDMAVVVSQSQNEIRDMQEKGLDIRPHRKRIVDEDLETKFKDPNDPFQLAFVCAMWMTGFDVPSCSTLYLDKPMRNHTLMQAIARANRVYPGKQSGTIVDYVGVFKRLESALAIYGSGSEGGEKPVADKEAQIAELRVFIDQITTFCEEREVDLAAIQAVSGFDRIKLLDDAVDVLVANDDTKRRFKTLAAQVTRQYKAILPDTKAKEFASVCILIRVLEKKIQSLTPGADISEIMGQVEDILDRSIAAEGYVITEDEQPIDLSDIDFEALKAKFESGRKRTEVEKLKNAIARKVSSLVAQNRTRMDYLERFQKLVDEYNSGSVNLEEIFRQLMTFAQSLTEEENRAVGENLSEEELAIYDLLTKPEMKLTKKDRDAIKKTAKALLETLKQEKFVLDWRKRQQSRSQVKVAIGTVLDGGLPRAFTPELFKTKEEAIFQHVYDHYYGAGRDAYQPAAATA